ncbi:hypothetical protein ACQKFG_21210 [Peribacillus sp. NPDC076916]|uniref:hypothetical protein n=1 Tax=Peribacillus sp. NPDC076916 TaxID=3390608 RepID=UPI003D05B7DB
MIDFGIGEGTPRCQPLPVSSLTTHITIPKSTKKHLIEEMNQNHLVGPDPEDPDNFDYKVEGDRRIQFVYLLSL